MNKIVNDDKQAIDKVTCDDSCMGTNLHPEQIAANLLSDDNAVKLADVFKTLGDPTRIKIVHALMQSELCVHDLTAVLGMGQSAISHQLRVLRNMRMVKRRKVGKTVFYSLDDDHVVEIFHQTLQHVTHD